MGDKLNVVHGFVEFKEFITENGINTGPSFYSYGRIVEVKNYPDTDVVSKYIVERVIDIRNFVAGNNKSTEILDFTPKTIPDTLLNYFSREIKY